MLVAYEHPAQVVLEVLVHHEHPAQVVLEALALELPAALSASFVMAAYQQMHH
jgi:hypothetical protein